MREAYELRARLRVRAVNPRVRDCGRRAITAVPGIVVREYENGVRRAWWRGLLKCGRTHSCPVCAERKAADRAAQLDRMMSADETGTWQMVTLTVRHHAGETLAAVLERLVVAWRRVRATRPVREAFAVHVTASVRAIEVTHGANGWHPHVHLLLRTDAWSESERAALLAAWLRAVDASTERGVVWSTPIRRWEGERARYLAKLGAELAGIGKAPKAGNRSPWQLADSAAHERLWREYQDTMHGRRMLEFDERAKALLDAAPEPGLHVREWTADVFSEEFSVVAARERVQPDVTWLLLDIAANAPEPALAARSALDLLLFREVPRACAKPAKAVVFWPSSPGAPATNPPP